MARASTRAFVLPSARRAAAGAHPGFRVEVAAAAADIGEGALVELADPGRKFRIAKIAPERSEQNPHDHDLSPPRLPATVASGDLCSFPPSNALTKPCFPAKPAAYRSDTVPCEPKNCGFERARSAFRAIIA